MDLVKVAKKIEQAWEEKREALIILSVEDEWMEADLQSDGLRLAIYRGDLRNVRWLSGLQMRMCRPSLSSIILDLAYEMSVEIDELELARSVQLYEKCAEHTHRGGRDAQ